MDIKSFVDIVDGSNDDIIKTPSLVGHEEVNSTIVLDTVDVDNEVEEHQEEATKKITMELGESVQTNKAPIPSRPPYVCHCTIRPKDEILNPIFRTVLMYGGSGSGSGGFGSGVGNSSSQQKGKLMLLLNRAVTDMFDDVFVKQLNFWKKDQQQEGSSSLLYISRERNKDTTIRDGGRRSRSRDRDRGRCGHIAVISCQEEESSSFQDWIVITPDEETTQNFLVVLRTHGLVATTTTK